MKQTADKFWVSVIGSVITILSAAGVAGFVDGQAWGMDPEQIMAVVSGIGATLTSVGVYLWPNRDIPE